MSEAKREASVLGLGGVGVGAGASIGDTHASETAAVELKLRPYQTAVIEAVRATIGRSVRVLIYSPTGSGKTEIAIDIIRRALLRGSRVVFLVNRTELARQAVRRFERAGLACGILQGDNTRDLSARVIVASIQTVARRGMPECDLVIIDEAHGVAGSAQYKSLLFKLNAVKVVGLTATPFAKGLGRKYPELGGAALFGDLVVAATISDLIAQGYLVDCDIYVPETPDLTGVKTQRNAFGEMDYRESDLSVAMNKPKLIGGLVEHYRLHGRNEPAVCFAVDIAHSKSIAERFCREGIPAEHLDGYTPQDERDAIFSRMRQGVTKVVSNVGVLCEGWDFPACRTLILARPTKSLTRYIQMIGRVLRPYPGKERAIVLDHSGSAENLPFPTHDLPLSLDDGQPTVAGKAKLKEPAKPSVCPSCKYLKPAGVHTCPSCNFAPQRKSAVVVQDGTLTKLDRAKAVTHDKQIWYSQFCQIAQARGYRLGWAAHRYREKFGVLPRGMKSTLLEPTTEVKNWLKSRQIAQAKSMEVRP